MQNLSLFSSPVRKVGRPRRVAIDDVQKQIAQLERFLGARDSLPLDLISRGAQARRIGQANRNAAQIYRLLQSCRVLFPEVSLTMARS